MTNAEKKEIKAIADYLNIEAAKAEKHAEAQEQAFNKWLTSRKGERPTSAGALPIATQVMKKAALLLNGLIR